MSKPNNLYQILKEILNEIYLDSDKSPFELKEPKEHAYPVTIVRYKGVSRCYKFDKEGLPPLLPFFNRVKHVNQFLDYVIFYPREGKLFVFLIELKSKKAEKANPQITATHNFTNYIIAMAKFYGWEESLKRPEDVKSRVIVIDIKGMILETNPRNKVIYKMRGDNIQYIVQRVGHHFNLEPYCI